MLSLIPQKQYHYQNNVRHLFESNVIFDTSKTIEAVLNAHVKFESNVIFDTSKTNFFSK